MKITHINTGNQINLDTAIRNKVYMRLLAMLTTNDVFTAYNITLDLRSDAYYVLHNDVRMRVRAMYENGEMKDMVTLMSKGVCTIKREIGGFDTRQAFTYRVEAVENTSIEWKDATPNFTVGVAPFAPQPRPLALPPQVTHEDIAVLLLLTMANA